jgi:hypothetical protein
VRPAPRILALEHEDSCPPALVADTADGADGADGAGLVEEARA